ncbi:hypothetical protein COR50_08535 [Chitinophaga caeni]|uniref:TPM domain-containing protein n=1 Tax=Chitinophaga caeni TaxID=2029983 RepID=A0A291QTL4_9BACT|nr:TPM domain-containing protein [Chitinophaga caeni]ATL47222.1 hypothetical protein COR50_08535 [Chitinophaga caeni]
MGMLPFKKKPIFNEDQQAKIVQAIRVAERLTSGEIRVYVENHCKYVDPMDRAREIFANLNMHETKNRNGVLLYLAMLDHQFAIFGDHGIHDKVGQTYWEHEANLLLNYLSQGKEIEGIASCIMEIGESLRVHFPYDNDSDVNELPDDIIFG